MTASPSPADVTASPPRSAPRARSPPTYAPLRAGVHQLLLHERHLADSVEEHDDLALAFVIDSYATEYAHPGSEAMAAVVEDLRAHRGAGQRKALARSALLRGHRFDAVDVREMRPRPDGSARTVLMLASPPCTSARRCRGTWWLISRRAAGC